MRSYNDTLRGYVPRTRRNKYIATSKKGVNARIPLLRYTYVHEREREREREHANCNATYMHEPLLHICIRLHILSTTANRNAVIMDAPPATVVQQCEGFGGGAGGAGGAGGRGTRGQGGKGWQSRR